VLVVVKVNVRAVVNLCGDRAVAVKVCEAGLVALRSRLFSFQVSEEPKRSPVIGVLRQESND